MKKKFVNFALLGAPIGLSITYLIPLFISFFIGDGTFHPVVPALAEALGNELNAVAVQAVVSLVYGAIFGGSSAIWLIEDWSILKQTAVHFAVVVGVTLPVAYFMRWMHRSVTGVLSYVGLFAAIYAVIWLAQYTATRKKVDELNKGLKSGTK
ncbi:MAG TPA: DUF3021 domain-containing protein [Clostridiales bacterium]|jgi:hypothetical protein|nr:DUF3021 domain-containing protein [Clostridiales bacterium]